jgi:hypothetical protein
MPVCARSASTICAPMVCTGFSEVIGSWKIIAMRPPRSIRRSSADRPAGRGPRSGSHRR